ADEDGQGAGRQRQEHRRRALPSARQSAAARAPAEWRNPPRRAAVMPRRLVAAGVAIIVLGIVALSSLFTVQEAEQAIVLELGRFVRIENKPGLHYKLPFIQDVRYFDKRVLDFEADLGEINTSDQKQTVVDTYARYRIVDALKFFQTARSIDQFEARRDD